MATVGLMFFMPRDEILNARHFALPHSDQRLVLMPQVLESFLKFRQRRSDPEAGGLLFGEFDFPLIRIVEASPPHLADQRWRTLFIPNRVLQRRLIKRRFRRGRHFVGEWHTHPEPFPNPSRLDLESLADAFLKSRHQLNYFVMIIVGNDMTALNLWVSAHDAGAHHRLKELWGVVTGW
jgi:integrative and conjugative element protein (TIGR02256 family)